MTKILVADDDNDIRDLLRILLTSNNYEVLEAKDGDEAVALCLNAQLIILDIMMPKKDGLQACKEIRGITRVPILFLSAKGQIYDKMAGLSIGADDYLVKPFTPLELLARINAMLRRWQEYGTVQQKGHALEPVCVGSLTLFEDSCKVVVNGRTINLTGIEFKILQLLCKTKGKVFSAQNIYESIWNEQYFYTANNTIMVHIRKLREKIEHDPQKPEIIKTVWGMGYKVDED